MTTENENILRTLADKPLLVTKVWCKFGLHRWTQWSGIKNTQTSKRSYQERSCAWCNKIEARSVTIDDK